MEPVLTHQHNLKSSNKKDEVKPMTEEEKKAVKARMEQLIDTHRKTFEKLAK